MSILSRLARHFGHHQVVSVEPSPMPPLEYTLQSITEPFGIFFTRSMQMLECVPAKPKAGQYRVDSLGRYHFNRADSGSSVRIGPMAEGLQRYVYLIIPFKE